MLKVYSLTVSYMYKDNGRLRSINDQITRYLYIEHRLRSLTRKIFSQSRSDSHSLVNQACICFFAGGEKIMFAMAPSIEYVGVPSFDDKLKDAHIVRIFATCSARDGVRAQ